MKNSTYAGVFSLVMLAYSGCLLNTDGLASSDSSAPAVNNEPYDGASPVCSRDGECDPNAKCIQYSSMQADGHGYCVCQLSFIGDGKTCKKNEGVREGALWPMEGGNTLHSRQSPFNGPHIDTKKWVFANDIRIEPCGFGSPVIDSDGSVFVGNEMGIFYQLNDSGIIQKNYHPQLNSGEEVHFSFAAPVLGENYVWVPGEKLYQIEIGTDEIAYSCTGKWFTSAPTIYDSRLYVGNDNGYLYSLDLKETRIDPSQDPQDCKDNNLVAMGGGREALTSAIAIWSSSLLIHGKSQTLYAFNLPSSGSDEFISLLGATPEARAAAGIHSSPSFTANGAAVYIGSTDGHLYSLDPKTGTLHWKYKTNGPIYSSPAIAANGTVYIGSSDRHLYAIRPDGRLFWSYEAGGEVNSSPAIGADGTVYFGSQDKNDDKKYAVYALNPNGSDLWVNPIASGRLKTSLAIGKNGTLYVSSDDGHVYAFGD